LSRAADSSGVSSARCAVLFAASCWRRTSRVAATAVFLGASSASRARLALWRAVEAAVLSSTSRLASGPSQLGGPPPTTAVVASVLQHHDEHHDERRVVRLRRRLRRWVSTDLRRDGTRVAAAAAPLVLGAGTVPSAAEAPKKGGADARCSAGVASGVKDAVDASPLPRGLRGAP